MICFQGKSHFRLCVMKSVFMLNEVVSNFKWVSSWLKQALNKVRPHDADRNLKLELTIKGVGKRGLLWNFLCAFIDSSIYDHGGSSITKNQNPHLNQKAAPHCGCLSLWGWGGGGHKKTHRHTNVHLRSNIRPYILIHVRKTDKEFKPNKENLCIFYTLLFPHF